MVGIAAKQRQFVAEYLVDLNATQAAIRAGYSARTAYSQGQRLLKHVEVARAIGRAMQERAERTRLKADDVVAEYRKLAFANILDFVRIQGDGSAVVDLLKLTRDQASSLAEITVDESSVGHGENARHIRRVRIKLCDKRAALSDLGRHLGIFHDRLEHSGPAGGPITLQNLSTEMLEELIAALAESTDEHAVAAKTGRRT